MIAGHGAAAQGGKADRAWLALPGMSVAPALRMLLQADPAPFGRRFSQQHWQCRRAHRPSCGDAFPQSRYPNHRPVLLLLRAPAWASMVTPSEVLPVCSTGMLRAAALYGGKLHRPESGRADQHRDAGAPALLPNSPRSLAERKSRPVRRWMRQARRHRPPRSMPPANSPARRRNCLGQRLAHAPSLPMMPMRVIANPRFHVLHGRHERHPQYRHSHRCRVSAESGLRTFRAEDGLWEDHRVEDVATSGSFPPRSRAGPALL